MKDLTLIIENVRTFRGRHEIPIRPLTILTGENSSGKTTLLAMFSAVCDRFRYPFEPYFNSAPYDLGSYETIASRKSDPKHGASHFSLGFRKPESAPGLIRVAEARYASEGGQIRLSDFRLSGSNIDLSVAVKEDAKKVLSGHATVRAFGKTLKESFTGLRRLPLLLFLSELGIRRNLDESTLNSRLLEAKDLIQLLTVVSSDVRELMPEAVSIAPIRTAPERVYSQFDRGIRFLGQSSTSLIAQNGQSSKTTALSKILKAFGKESGLFEELAPRRFGSGPADPFEIRVRLGGATVNLVDVGYGVSQVLPVLVETWTASPDQYLLLQQPEIHLHPRAQAALGSLFAQLAAENHCRLVIETHSDYVIDRVRQEVAAGKIAKDKVALLYLHREDLETKCHLIELDSIGNLINPPDYYRGFFLEETWRLLHRDARH